jgi:branched-subunit amino acid aminotransferase/4-amino-4-deoxychorismate lyase
MKHIDRNSFLDALESTRRNSQESYFAMYSGVLGGIVTDPALMMIPADDHIVHRGDGVFETIKCVGGNIYNMPAHLDRLEESASRLHLPLPCSREEITGITVDTVRAGEKRDCLIRILVSRGPGSLGVNPYDCPHPQLYVTACKLHPPFMATHPDGATTNTSAVPLKHSDLATVKTCNYVPNMLMYKEAVDSDVDFVIAFDEAGHMAEGATENMGIVTTDGRLLFPHPGRILLGTTLLRVMELAEQLIADKSLREVSYADISQADVAIASELLVLGTSRNVTAAVTFDGKSVGNGNPGPIQKRLNEMLEADILENTERLTPAFV